MKYKAKFLDGEWKGMADHVATHLLIRQDGRVMWYYHNGLEDITDKVSIEPIDNKMSTKQCRQTCDVYARWLEGGKKITRLENHIALHAGDCCSLSNESDMFRERAEEAEAELAWWHDLVRRHHKNFERSNLKEIVQSFIDRAEEAEAELAKSRERAIGNHRACERLARENHDLRQRLQE